MTSLSTIRARSDWRDIIEGQPQHLGLALLLTVGAFALLSPADEGPRLLWLTAPQWAKISIILAIVHQVVVAFVFRLQLHRALLSRILGERDLEIWTRIFLPLLVARPVTVILTGWADDTSLNEPRWAEWLVGVAFIGLAGWVMHSVFKYFTIRRAVGGDHFRDEIVRMPMVSEGAFKFTSNAMYGLAFLGMWGIALVFDSWNALVVAFFQHCYIWVHWYCTEKPDMEWLYGNR
ncbi:phospholipid methyltransferase [Shimia isoporae]|uniref:Phospholipid methyltransferase n=1 Tax=Shimia isoporae TaxID=647720 RepID=A0A4R1N1K8_9RHOB|nr:methyltransferase [Shimia isoporae]TCL00019.1 phospholipid methyltransferase [Shimia isoporae]